MLYRLITLCLPSLGILLCPFACLGTGVMSKRAMTSPCGCCEHSAGGDSLPQDETPPRDGCHHECVNNALVESVAKSLTLIPNCVFFVDRAWLSESLGGALSADRQTALADYAMHPESTSGIAVRLSLASLLL